MTYHEAVINYSCGLLDFPQLIAMKFDKETQEEGTCEHSLLERERREGAEYCLACGAYIDGPDGDGEDD